MTIIIYTIAEQNEGRAEFSQVNWHFTAVSLRACRGLTVKSARPLLSTDRHFYNCFTEVLAKAFDCKISQARFSGRGSSDEALLPQPTSPS